MNKFFLIVLLMVLIVPSVLAYDYSFDKFTPSDQRVLYNSGCYDQRISSYVHYTPDYCLGWPINLCFPTFRTVTPSIFFREAPSGSWQEYVFDPFEMTYNADFEIDMNPNVCPNTTYEWYSCVEESGQLPHCDNIRTFYVQSFPGTVDPPQVDNLRNCLYAGGPCYPSGTYFQYNVNSITPEWNMTVDSDNARICVYASSSIRGAFYSSCRTVKIAGGTYQPYAHDPISTVPGETVTWYATIDDFVNQPIYTSSNIIFHVYSTSNSPPVIGTGYPSGNTFSYPYSYVHAYATVTDSDSSQTALNVKFYLRKPSSSQYQLVCNLNGQTSSQYNCSFATNEAGRYYWKVVAVDEVIENTVEKTFNFEIRQSTINNNPPSIELISTSPQGNLPLGSSVSFTVQGSDLDNDNLWFSWYCRYDGTLSPPATDGEIYASTPDPNWAGPFTQPATYTMTCPDTTKQADQWPTAGTYQVALCITDGPEADGKEGFSSYNRCIYKEVRITDETYYDPVLRNQSIEFASCLVGNGCVLNEFYDGMVLFVSSFFIYFIWIIIAAIIFLVVFYTYVRVKEGFQ